MEFQGRKVLREYRGEDVIGLRPCELCDFVQDVSPFNRNDLKILDTWIEHLEERDMPYVVTEKRTPSKDKKLTDAEIRQGVRIRWYLHKKDETEPSRLKLKARAA